MPSWFSLQQTLDGLPVAQRGPYVENKAKESLADIGRIAGRNAIVYASGFLQKPQVPGIFTAVNPEDINGFMTCVQGVDCSKDLTLILHTPGGSAEAAETIVNYLWSKFSKIDALIPVYAMSAGTMIALACDRLIMGRQSQLGPTDPQLQMNGRSFSAHSIVDQFDEAKREISADPRLASAYAPVLQPFGPALLQEARKAVAYGRGLVRDWLAKHMFASHQNASADADRVADYFGGSQHGSHGHRIDRTEAKAQGLQVEDLEANQQLQDSTLTLYHLLTLLFDNGPAAKVMMSTNGSRWLKNVQTGVTLPPGMLPPGMLPPGMLPPGLVPGGGQPPKPTGPAQAVPQVAQPAAGAPLPAGSPLPPPKQVP
jgi:ATP-dependent protease ClpP protease subunit